MGVELLLEKASSTHPDQVALGSRAGGLRYGDLARAADHRPPVGLVVDDVAVRDTRSARVGPVWCR